MATSNLSGCLSFNFFLKIFVGPLFQSHQMLCTPLERPGSVGLPSGVGIMLLTDGQLHCIPEKRGEVCVKGASVTAGYINNPTANKTSFVQGFFRTGDEGYLDIDHGFLFLTGRIKEMINRGGEKISPREIDDVLLSHPLVKEAVAFGVEDAVYGHRVWAVVVLKHEAKQGIKQIKRHCEKYLAAFKCPENIIIAPSIPKTDTGKIQRLRVAEYFAGDRAKR